MMLPPATGGIGPRPAAAPSRVAPIWNLKDRSLRGYKFKEIPLPDALDRSK
jgi:hypothetical protein